MLVRLEESNLYVGIAGFRDVKIEDSEEIEKLIGSVRKQGALVQFLNAELVATWEHLYFAVLDAVVSSRNNCNISRKLEVEVMLYASGQRQIRKAIDVIGVKRGCIDLAVVVLSCDQALVKATLAEIRNRFGKETDDSILEMSRRQAEKIKRVFEISETELGATTLGDHQHALVNIVVERMALLATQV